MPRLMPKKPEARRPHTLRATRNVPYPDTSARPEFRIRRGEFAPATDHRVKSDPDAWKELPPLEERGPAPGRDESVAIAVDSFVIDGRMVFQGARFWPDDPLVRRLRWAFQIHLP